jgi:hypothetical protein
VWGIKGRRRHDRPRCKRCRRSHIRLQNGIFFFSVNFFSLDCVTHATSCDKCRITLSGPYSPSSTAKGTPQKETFSWDHLLWLQLLRLKKFQSLLFLHSFHSCCWSSDDSGRWISLIPLQKVKDRKATHNLWTFQKYLLAVIYSSLQLFCLLITSPFKITITVLIDLTIQFIYLQFSLSTYNFTHTYIGNYEKMVTTFFFVSGVLLL